MNNIDILTANIFELHNYFKSLVVQQVNNALTIRNWLTGFYIIEYEQNGNDRAAYGEKTLKVLSERISNKGLKGFSDRNLRLYRQFCSEYPEIWQSKIAKSELVGASSNKRSDNTEIQLLFKVLILKQITNFKIEK